MIACYCPPFLHNAVPGIEWGRHSFLSYDMLSATDLEVHMSCLHLKKKILNSSLIAIYNMRASFNFLNIFYLYNILPIYSFLQVIQLHPLKPCSFMVLNHTCFLE